jgi:hypothetical protein
MTTFSVGSVLLLSIFVGWGNPFLHHTNGMLGGVLWQRYKRLPTVGMKVDAMTDENGYWKMTP